MTGSVDVRKAIALAIAAITIAAMVPAAADAATVGVKGPVLRYIAQGAEQNAVSVSHDYFGETVTLVEAGPGASLTAGKGCVQVDATTATCEMNEGPGGPGTIDFWTLSVATGLGDDSIEIDSSVGFNTSLNGGSGDDSIVGGLGADKLLGGPGNDSLKGGDNPDQGGIGDGIDTFIAGGGNDLVDSREADGNVSQGVADRVINCGGGTDQLYRDTADSGKSCEAVSQ